MRRQRIRRPLALLVPLVLVVGGCAPEIEIVPAPTGLTTVVFDPSSDPVDIPTPTDLAVDQTTGLVAVPVADATEHPAQAYFDAFLNTLNGFPTVSTAEVRFDGELAPETVSDKTIIVLETDPTNPAAVSPVTGLTIDYEKVEGTPATSRVIISHPTGWSRGKRYVFYVLGGANGVKNTANKPVIRSAMFEIAAGTSPLCAWNPSKSWNATSMSCTAPAAGATATGCCTYNYSGLVESTVKSEVRDDPMTSGMSTEEVELLVHKKVLETATTFETLRRSFEQILGLGTAAAQIPRDDVAVVWSFKVVDQTELLYDPTAGVIPFPNDLLLDPSTGMVNIPATPGETPSEMALREGLNTLDGFTTQGTYYVAYSGKVDPKTIAGSMIAVDAAAGTMVPMTFEVDEAAGAIKATPISPLKEKTQYALVLISKRTEGSQMAASGLADTAGRYLVPASFMELIKSPHPLLDAAKKSTISTVDDATAQQIEPARLAHKQLFDSLEQLQIKRDDVVCAWAFTTQSITEDLLKLRAAPWQILAVLDANKPTIMGTLSTDLSGYPTQYPVDKAVAVTKTNIGGWVENASFINWLLLDEAGTGAFHPDPTKGKAVQIPMTITVPKGVMPPGGWPLAIYQHGIFNSRKSYANVADKLAGAGFAMVAMDMVYHGERSWCTEDAHCASSGTCDVTTGKCSTSLLLDAEGEPVASGERLFNLANPFAIRDNIRQHVVDSAALMRIIALSAAGGYAPLAGVKFNPTKVHYVARSLGAIAGTLVAATTSLAKRWVLAVPGAPLSNIVLDPPKGGVFEPTKQGLLKSFGVTEGTLDYLKLKTTFQWILDPADSGNFARFVKQEQLPDLVTDPTGATKLPAKEVMVQLAGKDEWIGIDWGKYLARAIGADTTKTLYPDQMHSFLSRPSPSAGATKAAQTQMTTFLTTGTICTPSVAGGTCN